MTVATTYDYIAHLYSVRDYDATGGYVERVFYWVGLPEDAFSRVVAPLWEIVDKSSLPSYIRESPDKLPPTYSVVCVSIPSTLERRRYARRSAELLIHDIIEQCTSIRGSIPKRLT